MVSSGWCITTVCETISGIGWCHYQQPNSGSKGLFSASRQSFTKQNKQTNWGEVTSTIPRLPKYERTWASPNPAPTNTHTQSVTTENLHLHPAILKKKKKKNFFRSSWLTAILSRRYRVEGRMPILLQVVTYTDTLLSKVHSLLRALPLCRTPYGFGQMCNDILHPGILADCNGEQGHALLRVQDLLLTSSNSLCPSDSLGSGPPSGCLSPGITDILLWPRP